MTTVYLIFRLSHRYDHDGNDEYDEVFDRAYANRGEAEMRIERVIDDAYPATPMTTTIDAWTGSRTYTVALPSRGLREIARLREVEVIGAPDGEDY